MTKIKKDDMAPDVLVAANYKYWLDNMHGLPNRAPQLENELTIYQNVNYTMPYVHRFFEKEEIRTYLKRLVTDNKVKPGKSPSAFCDDLLFRMLETNFDILVENINNITFLGYRSRPEEFLMSFNGFNPRYNSCSRPSSVFYELMNDIAKYLYENNRDNKVVVDAIRNSTSASHSVKKLKALANVINAHQ